MKMISKAPFTPGRPTIVNLLMLLVLLVTLFICILETQNICQTDIYTCTFTFETVIRPLVHSSVNVDHEIWQFFRKYTLTSRTGTKPN